MRNPLSTLCSIYSKKRNKLKKKQDVFLSFICQSGVVISSVSVSVYGKNKNAHGLTTCAPCFFFLSVSHSSYVSNLISFLSRFVRLPTEEVLRVESPYFFFIIIMILRFIRVCVLHSTFKTQLEETQMALVQFNFSFPHLPPPFSANIKISFFSLESCLISYISK